MSNANTISNNEKNLILQERLKAYTKIIPSDNGVLDMAYHHYLRNCAELYPLSNQLNECVYLELTPDEMAEKLMEIETSINQIIV